MKELHDPWDAPGAACFSQRKYVRWGENVDATNYAGQPGSGSDVDRRRCRTRRYNQAADGTVGRPRAAAEVPGDSALRSGQPGSAGSPCGVGQPGQAPVHRPDAGEQRRRADRDHDHGGDPRPGRRHAVEQLRRSDRTGGGGRREGRRQGRDLGLADPVRQGRDPLRCPGGLQRYRRRHGRHGAQHSRRFGKVRSAVGNARRGESKRLDRGNERRLESAEIRQPRGRGHGLWR